MIEQEWFSRHIGILFVSHSYWQHCLLVVQNILTSEWSYKHFETRQNQRTLVSINITLCVDVMTNVWCMACLSLPVFLCFDSTVLYNGNNNGKPRSLVPQTNATLGPNNNQFVSFVRQRLSGVMGGNGDHAEHNAHTERTRTHAC